MRYALIRQNTAGGSWSGPGLVWLSRGVLWVLDVQLLNDWSAVLWKQLSRWVATQLPRATPCRQVANDRVDGCLGDASQAMQLA